MVDVLFTDEFGAWWDGLSAEEQASIDRSIGLLADAGPVLPYPHSSGIKSSVYPAMRELRIQHGGRPYRVLYIFDRQRQALLLIGGDKTGNDRWYEIHVPIAERIYRQYLNETEEQNGR